MWLKWVCGCMMLKTSFTLPVYPYLGFSNRMVNLAIAEYFSKYSSFQNHIFNQYLSCINKWHSIKSIVFITKFYDQSHYDNYLLLFCLQTQSNIHVNILGMGQIQDDTDRIGLILAQFWTMMTCLHCISTICRSAVPVLPGAIFHH